MKRIIAFVKAQEGATLDWDALVAANGASGDASRVYRVIAPPPDLPYRPPSDPSPEQSRRQYDGVVMIDGIDRLPDHPIYRALTTHAYAVQARPIFRREPQRDTGSAITLLGRLMFHADLPDSAARRSWALHAPLAERVHVGACCYVQNWVTHALSPDCPATRAMPEMRFPDEEALVTRFFDSDRGRMEILQDTAHFVASGPRFYLRKYLTRP